MYLHGIKTSHFCSPGSRSKVLNDLLNIFKSCLCKLLRNHASKHFTRCKSRNFSSIGNLLTMDEEYLSLWHFGRHFAVDRARGSISALSDDQPIPVTPRLNIYTLFWYASPEARILDEWVPFRELRDASPFSSAFQSGILAPLAQTFTGRGERLLTAVRRLRGEQLSETSFLLPAFACMPTRLNFWDADEEFPAQANLLFDKSATDYIHVESVVTIASEALYQLAEAAGLPLKGSPFYRF